MKLRRPEQYETLARVRKLQADQKAQELAYARNKLKNLELQREELEAYQRRVLEEAGRQAAEPIPERMRGFYRFERHLGRLADAKGAEIETYRREVEERREHFEEAVRKRRIVDRLIEKAEQRIRERFDRHEQRFHDEVASIQFARRNLNQRRKERANEHAESSRNTRAGGYRLSGGAHRAHGGDG